MSEISDRDVTDWLAKGLWTVARDRLVADPATTQDSIISALMLEVAGYPGFLIDSEGAERFLRQRLAAWWPEIQRYASTIRALLAEQGGEASAC